MNAAQWATLGTIVAIIVGIISVVLLAKQSAREGREAREKELDKARNEARSPLVARNADLEADLRLMTEERNYHRERADRAEEQLRNRGMT